MTIDPISLEIARIVIRTVCEGSGKLLEFMGRNLDDTWRKLVFVASQRYQQNYEARHGIIKCLGMRDSVPLESIYAEVQFLGNQDIQRFASFTEIEANFREAGRRSFQLQTIPKQNGLSVANQHQFLMVLGAPGAGKSTFLRRVGLEALKGKQGQFQHGCIPVFIDLKEFNTNEANLEALIESEFATCGFPQPKDSTHKLLEQGKLLILLDGLDEVSDDRRDRTIRQIQDFVDRYDQNRFLASCRLAVYRHNFRRFRDVAMAEFNDEQSLTFITNWFKRDINAARECWQTLNSSTHKAAKELTQTPLLLTLICLLYQRSRRFPNNRATLYERALRVLLEEWAAEKGIPQAEIYKGLDTKRKELMLAEIAHHAFQADQLFFPKRDLANQIEQLLGDLLPDEKLIDGSAVLRTIEAQHGVLVQRAEGIYSFSHLTIQEYLTAQYIDDHHQIESLVQNHLKDERWREVFLLVAGLMRGGADALLLQMERQSQTYLQSAKLKALSQWADHVTANSAGQYKPAAKRTAAIFFICFIRAHDLDLARDLARALDFDLARALDLARVRTLARTFARDLPLDLARTLHKLDIFSAVDLHGLVEQLKTLQYQVPSKNQPDDLKRAFMKHLQRTWYTALALDLDCFVLSDIEIQSLKDYFYICELMVRCKEAAVRVSSSVWAEIEARMVTV